jgi:hypothetical protein
MEIEGCNEFGQPKVVEIDESKFIHRKYNRSQWSERHWVLEVRKWGRRPGRSRPGSSTDHLSAPGAVPKGVTNPPEGEDGDTDAEASPNNNNFISVLILLFCMPAFLK